jgi:copper chaperone CopZ
MMKKREASHMSVVEIQASNIKCGGCVSSIQDGLKELDGITAVSVDIASNMVSVEGANLDSAAIEAKLAALGYPIEK